MLKISSDQFEALQRAISAPERRSRARALLESFPRFQPAMDASRVEALLRLTDARTGELGAPCERSITLHAYLALRFGVDWDRDPQHAWAARGSDTPVPDAAAAISSLVEAASAWRLQVMGADDGRFIGAAQRFVSRPADEWLAAAGRSQSDLLTYLAWLHPEKRAALPDETVAALVRQALDECRAIGMTERAGIVLCTVLAFLFGSGVLHDPVFAEIGTALADPALTTVDRVRVAAQAASAWTNLHLLAPTAGAAPVVRWPIPGLDSASLEPIEAMIVRPKPSREAR
jgi:hypothetical protein